MTALDLSTFEALQDSPEIAEYKERVKKVADEYTKRHGWCRQVKNALKEIGIEDEKPISVNVTTTMGFVIQTKVLPSKLIDKTEDEQKEIIAKKIGKLHLTGTGSAAQLVITAGVIQSLELADGATSTSPASKTLLQSENGSSRYVWRRTTEGRVLHLWSLNADGMNRIHLQSDTLTRGHVYGGTACNRIELNSYSSTLLASDWSAEDEDRAECADCERKVNAWGLFPYEPEVQ